MVDSRLKGARAETIMRDQLRALTGLPFERVPSSGALDPKHGLKGDLYLVGVNNTYCIEVKSYADCYIDHSLISGSNPQIIIWLIQTIRQGYQVSKKPLLLFKHDRSKTYCAFLDMPEGEYSYIFVSKNGYEFYISLLDDYINNNKPEFILNG